MKHATAEVTPTRPAERILALDVLRGVAILGILIMNIQSFSMIGAAYINPTAFGDLSGLNYWVWLLSHIFADQKFMTLFSILFGAGVVLMTRRAEDKEQSAVGLHYRRTFWLLIIGLLHAYLLWYGDILVTYALCALGVFLFRKASPRKLLIIGLLVFSVASLVYLMSATSMSYWPPASVEEIRTSWRPSPGAIEREIAAYRGGWIEQMAHRIPTAIEFQTFLFLIFFSWRAAGLMLVGMALFKWGILTGDRSTAFYRKMVLAGLLAGLPLVLWGVVRNFDAGWTLEYSMFQGVQFNYWGSVLVALAYIGMVMLICKSSRMEKVLPPLAAVGRTALSNYLLQSLICTSIFYGHGLGWFGATERKLQILIVLAVWIIQLAVSPLWLRHFRFGPAEWLWRSLTYGHLQPWRN